jgi:hypothetical protein
MPIYDRICPAGHKVLDVWEPIATTSPPCRECGLTTERAWLTKSNAVIPDEIPGGIWIRHGICNEDGTPRKYYSKSEMIAEAKRRGLTNAVRHIGTQGSDKSPHTIAWTSIPQCLTQEQEDERKKRWWDSESPALRSLIEKSDQAS